MLLFLILACCTQAKWHQRRSSPPLRPIDSEAVIERLKQVSLPWQGDTWDQATPWDEYREDLRGLLRRRCHRAREDPEQRTASCRWVTLVTINHMEQDSKEELLLLNMLTSYLLVAKHDNYIVACATEEAVAACRRLRLPCYDARDIVEDAGINTTSLSDGSLGSANLPSYWSKVAIARQVLKVLPEGAFLHVTDYDVVYLKRIYRSAELFFANNTNNFADATMCYEHWSDRVGTELRNIHVANTGVIFVRNTEMASRMYDRWLAAATSAHHDQTGFAWQYGKAYMLCVDALTCELTATVAQMPAVIRHHTPWQDNRVCPDCKNLPYTDPNGVQMKRLRCFIKSDHNHCETEYRLYVHLICFPKVSTLQAMGLWFLKPSDPRRTDYEAIVNAGLPCHAPQDVAQMRPTK